MHQYEAMFVFDPTFGSPFEKCEEEVRRLIERAQGQILACRKWEERRLAYRIRGRKRGIYALVFFEAAPDKIPPLERDAKLSENILRLLVLRADGLTPEAMERALPTRDEEPAKTGDDAEKVSAPAATADEAPKGDAAPVSETLPVATETAVEDAPESEASKTE